jgi:hypothetical protein
MFSMNRRWVTSGIAALLLLAIACAQGCTYPQGYPKKGKIVFNDKDFYDRNGKFSEAAAKQAYLDFLTYYGYPLSDNLKANINVTDFGLGKFTKVGMAYMGWCTNQTFGYTGREIFLLPNQMIPENWAVKTDDTPVKMASWQLRHGEAYVYTEGDPTSKIRAEIPAIQLPFVTVRHETILKVGQVTGVTRPSEKSWMMSSPMGAIMTEYSTYHDPKAIKFSDPNIKF